MELYKYLRLEDAVMCIDRKVNFYGVIAEYEQPKPTRGSDLICTMTVVDMSYHKCGLRVLVFAPTVEVLPHVQAVGDVIRFHRAWMTRHNDAPQAKVSLKWGAFVLLQGKGGQGYVPYQVSHGKYTLEEHDWPQVDLLRVWAVNHPLDTGENKYAVPIKGIKEGCYFDLCCKILFVEDKIAEHSFVMYVWDGTDAPPAELGPRQQTETDESEQGLGNSQEWAVPRNVMHGFPALGTALALVPEMGAEELLPGLPQAGDWVKLRNLGCRVREGLYECLVQRESKISLLSSQTRLVQDCERAYQERLATEEARLPQWFPRPPQSITVTDYEHVSLSTLREVLSHPELWHVIEEGPCGTITQLGSVTTYLYKHCKGPGRQIRKKQHESQVALVCLDSRLYTVCVGILSIYRLRTNFVVWWRVIATWPSEVLDFCGPLESLHDAQFDGQQVGAFVYGVRLTLEDPTARLHAFLYGEDAVGFFNGHPAADLRQQGATVGALQRKVGRLLGVQNSGSRNPPWVKCCLKAYYTD